MIEKGEKAPLFEGKDENGNEIRLKDFLGKNKKTVLYFYPKDDTTTCTKQACNLRDNYETLLEKGYQIIGVSVDNEKSHQKFIQKYELPFPLIADTEKSIVEAYGVWQEKSMYGRKYMGTVRVTYMIDSKGIVEAVISKVKSSEHAKQILSLNNKP